MALGGFLLNEIPQKELNMYLKEASVSDYPLIMAWRSNPKIYQGFYSQKSPLVWEGHLKWFLSRNQDWRTFLIIYEDRPIGVVNIGQLDHWSPEIGYFIGEVSLWGRGLGTMAVKLGIEWLQNYAKSHLHITCIHTTIKDDNIASIKLIKRLGFGRGMGARKGEHYWQREL